MFAIGDEGGYSIHKVNEEEVFELILEAIEISKPIIDGDVVITIDVAASQFYNAQQKIYEWFLIYIPHQGLKQ